MRVTKSSRYRPPPPTPYLATPPRESSPTASTLASASFSLSDCEADDEDMMSSDTEATPTRLPTLAIPQAPCSPERPTLAEILSNTAPPPWSLTAFMGYLSQNHCLENLEFTMDASRYRDHYHRMGLPATPISPNDERCKYVRMLWQRLLDAYIIPNGPREVNLPSNVRDRLLSLPNNYAPPRPDELDPAVHNIYVLMDESVLAGFLNSVHPFSATSQPYNGMQNPSSDDTDPTSASLDHHHPPRRGPRPRGRSNATPPPPLSTDFGPSNANYLNHNHNQSHITSSGPWPNPLSTSLSNTSSINGDTDDSGAASSPTREPMTPPSTPPTSDYGGTSPRSRSDGPWKKMTGRLGWSKKRSGTGLRDSRSSGTDDDQLSPL
ncbi:MAG: hypothetical protein M1829_002875 [Trizodia sp. TS-e1964]|nr:MAG: hypothetical protein M1829_002875 [Trizodia sp. TS-e1964]